MHLTVFSYPPEPDPFLDPAVFAVQPNRSGGHIFGRCSAMIQLPELIRRAALKVTLLDLVGHNDGGIFRLGHEPVLQRGEQVPQELKDYLSELSEDATVRILGCETGTDEDGGALLQSLSEILGKPVIGTKCVLFAHDFSTNGLKPDLEKKGWLVSTQEPRRTVFRRVPRTYIPPEGEEGLNKWGSILPTGYVAVGRAQPLVRRDFMQPLENATLTLAYQRRLVLIEDDPKRPPLVWQWNSSEPVPSARKLRSLFSRK